MKTGSKITLAFLIILLLSLGGVVIYVLGSLDALVAGAIEKYGSEATGTAVRVEKVRIHLKEGEGSILGLTIANPPGFSGPHAFRMGEITTRINLDALAKQDIVIDEIRILQPTVDYEINASRQGNLDVLADRLGGEEQSAAGGQPPVAEEKAQVLTIRRFIMKDARLQATIVPLGKQQYSLTLPPLVLSNLHGTPGQISRQVLDQLVDHARKAVRKAGFDRELEKYKAQARQRLEAEKARAQRRLDEEKARQQKALDERLEQEKRKAEDSLRNLLKR